MLGFETLRLAVDTHAITSHFALPWIIKTPGGLVVEVTDGTAEYNATHYLVFFLYDLAKASNLRMAFALAHELRPYRCTAVAVDFWLAAFRDDAGCLRCQRSQLA